jgi:hypothetical protein
MHGRPRGWRRRKLEHTIGVIDQSRIAKALTPALAKLHRGGAPLSALYIFKCLVVEGGDPTTESCAYIQTSISGREKNTRETPAYRTFL